MHPSLSLLLASLALATAQLAGNPSLHPEEHPRLQWTQCAAAGDCRTIDGELTVDENWRWLRDANGYANCYDTNQWVNRICTDNCTEACALEGADYRFLGVATANASVTQKLVTRMNFAENIGSRLYLLESKNKYQTFRLLDNEFAFDVNLSTAGCGINSALHFIEMEADGGMARFPTNKAGAEYGTGYCNSQCTRGQRYVGGKANNWGWIPSEHDQYAGEGSMGACCAEVAFWDSNSHSYQMSTQTCDRDGYQVCEGENCAGFPRSDAYSISGQSRCDSIGCGFNPFRMGAKDFYGKGKIVDTSRVFTVVTRFTAANITQFFVQDGRKIEVPVPTIAGLPAHNGLTPEMCTAARPLFGERNRHLELGGWDTNLKLLTKPLVLSMEINVKYYDYNLWLDGNYPNIEPEAGFENEPGNARGDCQPWQDSDPVNVIYEQRDAKVVWSNFRFGPIGSTVKA